MRPLLVGRGCAVMKAGSWGELFGDTDLRSGSDPLLSAKVDCSWGLFREEEAVASSIGRKR